MGNNFLKWSVAVGAVFIKSAWVGPEVRCVEVCTGEAAQGLYLLKAFAVHAVSTCGM